MAYTYATYVSALQTMLPSQSPDPSFDAILPSCIDYAEQRIYRELNLISTVVTDVTTTLSGGERNATIPDEFVVVNRVNLLTPAGVSIGSAVRVPLIPVTQDVLDFMWPGNSPSGQPSIFAMVTQWTLVLGPAPDGAYNLEVIGTQRPAPLSVSNPTTFLSERLPDLFFAASMVFLSGYQKNFGGQSGDPAMSSSWESQYQALKASANSEELRKSFVASSWSSQPVSSEAQPQRG